MSAPSAGEVSRCRDALVVGGLVVSAAAGFPARAVAPCAGKAVEDDVSAGGAAAAALSSERRPVVDSDPAGAAAGALSAGRAAVNDGGGRVRRGLADAGRA